MWRQQYENQRINENEGGRGNINGANEENEYNDKQ
jgi:hypothetical protein